MAAPLPAAALSLALALALALATAVASPFDPHPLHAAHSSTPFFEGWYVRISADAAASSARQRPSVALILGSYQAAPRTTSTGPHLGSGEARRAGAGVAFNQTYVALLLQTGESGTGTTSVQRLLTGGAAEVGLTAHGEPVSGEPGKETPSVFSWRNTLGSLSVDDDTAVLHFTVGDFELQANLSARRPWDWLKPDGPGPEGPIVSALPEDLLPCHYYVQSLGSRASFSVVDRSSGRAVMGGAGHAHLEANWGEKFPVGWTWAQAISPDGGVSLSLTGGLFEFGPVTALEGMVAVRTAQANVTMRTLDAVEYDLTFAPDACNGRLHVTGHHRLTGLPRVAVTMESAPAAFAEQLYTPTDHGFTQALGCVESFATRATIVVETKQGVVVNATFGGAALEFGGSYQCPPKLRRSHTPPP